MLPKLTQEDNKKLSEFIEGLLSADTRVNGNINDCTNNTFVFFTGLLTPML